MIQGKLEDGNNMAMLMSHFLKACEPYIYANERGKPKWENVVVDKYKSLMMNKT